MSHRLARLAVPPLLGGLALLALGCAAPATPAGAPPPASAGAPTAPPVEHLTSGAGTLTSFGTTFPRLVAAYLGYFADEGLQVDVVNTGGDAPTLAGMIAGDIHVAEAIGTDGLVLANAKGQPFYALAAYLNSLNYSLMGAPGVSAAAGLRGGTVAISRPGDTTDRYARVALRHLGLEPERDVALVAAQSSPERARSLLAGVVQGALIGRSENSFLRRHGATELVDLRDLFPDYSNRVIATSGRVLEERPRAVQAFVKGMVRAYQWLAEPSHRADAPAIVAWAGLDVDDLDQAYDDLVRGLAADGEINPRGLERVIQDLQAGGQVPADYTADQLVRSGPLRAAQQELGLTPSGGVQSSLPAR
ncbi:MAG TPA: ABC transporter substrate-binding protein [Chloroflexota bacterium]|nr:ABC transporter substrate-binding protein [Chloroflexota bacterium]